MLFTLYSVWCKVHNCTFVMELNVIGYPIAEGLLVTGKYSMSVTLSKPLVTFLMSQSP